ncbi:MAG: hypothetical protein ACFFDW_03105 [Candidatus Thorarchaeota archaeon]
MGYDPAKRCMKCSKNQGYLYYCEDCHGTFCNDCIISEKTECTFCNDCSHISTGNKCELCGKTNNLSAAKKYLRKCPICSSIRIKDIPKKISGLSNEYVETVNLLYKALDTIRNFAMKYSEVVNQSKYIRRERYGLYPLIESNLIRIQGQFYEIVLRGSELVDKTYQQISEEAKLLQFNQQITVNKLPDIDKILKMIRTHAHSYSNLINDFLSDSQHELKEVDELVNEIKSYLFYFDSHSDKFETDLLELKIAAFPDVKVSLPDSNSKKNGILFITNKTLYFLPIHKFFFRLRGKARAIPLSIIKDVELRERRILGSKIIVNIPDRKNMTIKCSINELEKLNFLFGVLFNDNEGYIINDPYILEELRGNLDFTAFRDRIDRRVKDLKQLPFSHVSKPINWDRGPIINIPYETKEIRELRIKLRAARDTLIQLKKAFEDRNISPENYFPRLEKTQEKIFQLEEDLKDALRTSSGLDRNQNYSEGYGNMR